MPIDYSGGYAASWRLVRVDERTWLDGGALGGVLGGSATVSRDSSDAVPLLESADAVVDMEPSAEFAHGWYRLEMLAQQGGVSERMALGTFLFDAGDSEYQRGRRTFTASGRSVLYPCSERKLLDGSYAPKGGDGAAYAGALIAASTPAPVLVHGSFELGDHVVHAFGDSYLKGAWDVLDAGGWCVRIDGRGTVHVMPMPTEPAGELDASVAVTQYSKVTRPERPANVYVAVDGSDVAVAEDAAAIAADGRRIEQVDTAPIRVNGETLAAYAARRLYEGRTAQLDCSWTRGMDAAELRPFDLVRASLPSYGMVGTLRIRSQKVTCGRGASVDETAVMEVRL